MNGRYRERGVQGGSSVWLTISASVWRGLSYAGFREYLNKLKVAEDGDVRINWAAVIDIDGIEAVDHSKRAGLQIADIIAAGMTAGLEPDIYGNCERRYAEILKSRIYCRNANYLSYGVKLVPWADKLPLSDQQKAFVALFRKNNNEG